jgi:hypothetical protein
MAERASRVLLRDPARNPGIRAQPRPLRSMPISNRSSGAIWPSSTRPSRRTASAAPSTSCSRMAA